MKHDKLLTLSSRTAILGLLLFLTGCVGGLHKAPDPFAYSRPLLASEYSRILSATRSLPERLKRILPSEGGYRVLIVPEEETTGHDISQNKIIGLKSSIFDSDTLDDKTLLSEILRDLFKVQYGQLNLFCEDITPCRDLNQKRERLQLLLRGRYLQSGLNQAIAPSLETAYAFHATKFFTDDDYACRHPLIARGLQAIWGFYFKTHTCKDPVPSLVSNWEKPNKIVWVDPDRVYAIHLLFAGPGEDWISSFGHIGLRLVVCRNDRIQVDNQCEIDLFDHLALGFRAHVDEINLSYWTGITGGYKVKLYANPFMEVYDEYSIDEFRDVYSLPLILTKEAKRFLVSVLSEVHWFYYNDYRFFSQNCATELQWLLDLTFNAQHVSDEKFFHAQHSRPDLLFDEARSSDHFHHSVLVDLSLAEQNGYFFANTRKYYQLALDTLISQLPVAEPDIPHTLDEWIGHDALFRRKHWLIPASSFVEKAKQDKRTKHAEMVLEGWVARRLKRKMFSDLMLYYKDIVELVAKNQKLLDEPEEELLLECMNLIKSTEIMDAGMNGIPQNVTNLDTSSKCDTRNPAMPKLAKKILAFLPISQVELKTMDELKFTLENIRQIYSRE